MLPRGRPGRRQGSGQRVRALGGLALWIALGSPAPASAAGPAEPAHAARAGASRPQNEAARPGAARPGAYCLPGGCRPTGASLWNGAAFGGAVVALAWQARRRPSASA